jgi:peptide/nickel transport system substrate-binding protein
VNRISGVPFVAPHKLAWFRDVRFRRAVSCGLDRDRLVREVYAGRAVPSETYLGSESGRWHNPDVPCFGFDRARARQLLAEAGLQDRNGDGIAEDTAGRACEITLLINTGNPTRERVAAFLAEDLRQIGIRMVLQAVPFPALEKQINADFEYEAVLMGLSGGGGDPASHLNVLKSDEPLHQWFPNQSQPATAWEARVDALMDALMRTLDFETRKRAFDEVQVILAEQAPMIYTATPLVHAAARTNLMNLRPALLAPSPVTWNTEELWWGTE